MSEPTSEELCEDIHTRHKRERKELQCKVQALKKSATKGDKKKKKEVQEEIIRLEQELEKRQSEELLQVQEADVNELTESVNSLCTNETDDVPAVHRISKAQKRRDKKAIKEKEREKLIEAQEKENINGVRNVEIKTLNSILKERRLLIHEIPSDGDCLYCAIVHQLKLAEEEKYDIQKLRLLTSRFLLDHMDDFLPFLSHSESGEFLNDVQYKEYCDKVANTSAWGGEVELRALSHVLKRPIEVIQAVGPIIIIGEEYDKEKALILTYHRHMYGLGEHYNSVKPFQVETEQTT